MEHLNIGYNPANYYLLLAQPKALLVDIGFPQNFSTDSKATTSSSIRLAICLSPTTTPITQVWPKS
jgi:hypothetical protein